MLEDGDPSPIVAHISSWTSSSSLITHHSPHLWHYSVRLLNLRCWFKKFNCWYNGDMISKQCFYESQMRNQAVYITDVEMRSEDPGEIWHWHAFLTGFERSPLGEPWSCCLYMGAIRFPHKRNNRHHTNTDMQNAENSSTETPTDNTSYKRS